MASDRADCQIVNATQAPQGASGLSSPKNPKRILVDFTDRGTLKRLAMGPARSLPADSPSAGGRPAWTRQYRHTRGVNRWQLLPGKRGACAVGKTKRCKGSNIMAITDASGIPVAVRIESSSPHEVKLFEDTIGKSFTLEKPAKIIGDKAYNSNPLDNRLRDQHSIEMIAPHRNGRKKPKI